MVSDGGTFRVPWAAPASLAGAGSGNPNTILETGPSLTSLKEVSCRQSPSRKLKRGLLELHEKSIQRIRSRLVLCRARGVRPLLSPLSGAVITLPWLVPRSLNCNSAF